MQQRQLRLGDILDDYCTRERRVTNHAVVAMIEQEVKQTRCTTCDTEHEYKHAKVPRQRRKSEAHPALSSPTSAVGPKRVVHESAQDGDDSAAEPGAARVAALSAASEAETQANDSDARQDEEAGEPPAADGLEDGPVHRPLIRATLPRIEGQPPPSRPAPEFTLRQPAPRHGRFRPRQQQQQRGALPFQGNRSGNNARGGGMPRPGDGRPPMMSRPGKRHGPGRKRSK